ncbi:glycosyltransferase [Achromobacter denitrificans]|uniref:glycosyltransferase n=1 Tax=Achromobacter denitrificans TaxID=32002 RepID=UPI00240E10D5|nr:glycosyltransferase [Achromobacter denitrificans]WFC68447.1 glycosyltransferase [Achromobacter denitrificans]
MTTPGNGREGSETSSYNLPLNRVTHSARELVDEGALQGRVAYTYSASATHDGGRVNEIEYWLKGESEQNLGDFLSEYFAEHLFIRTTRPGVVVRMVGSALADAFVPERGGALAAHRDVEQSPTLVAWGLGVRDRGSLTPEARSRVDILAVRGSITAAEVQAGADVPMGDPGLLMPALYSPQHNPEYAGKRVCIPHFHDRRNDEAILAASGCDLVLRTSVPNELKAIEEFIDKLASASFILSGSLHGAILAVAYGVPYSYWDSGTVDLPLKWEDFSTSIGTPTVFVRDVAEGEKTYSEVLKDAIRLPSVLELLGRSPYIPRPDALLKIVQYEMRRRGVLARETDDALSDATKVFEDGAAHFQKIADEATAAQRAIYRADLGRMAHRIAAVRQIEKQQSEEIAQLRAHAAGWHAAHDRIANSAAWKATSIPRRVVDRLKSTKALLKRGMSAARARANMSERRDIAILRNSKLFDEDWYYERYPDVRNGTVDLLRHYVQHGAAEGRSPRRFFDAPYYISQAASNVRAKTNPLLHYITEGRDAGLIYSEAFEKIGKITFPKYDNPVVTIIIPTYGQVDYTVHCLYSLYKAEIKVPFEIIVAEDASGDPDVARLRVVNNIRLIEREKNLGFLRSCNAAAQEARGSYIFLLNNDTEVASGAIEALLDTFERWPTPVGMAGSKLLYPDGSLQEAGGLVWNDGSAANLGRMDDPEKHEYTYRRPTDYISGAAIMLPRQLWMDLGGFDEHYLPAYCEDSDLAFRVRQAGYEVVYTADSEVVHFEGISHGRDTNTGVKASQVANSQKLFQRWRSILNAEHSFPGDKSIRARDRVGDRKVVLIIDHYVPEPDRDAGSRTMATFIDQLIAMGRIVKFWPDNRYRSPGYTDALLSKGVEVLYGQEGETFDSWITENGGDIDEVLLSRPHISPPYIPLLRTHTRAVLAYYGHDLHHARMFLEAQKTNNELKFLDAAEMRDQEIGVWRSVDAVLYPSEDEAREVLRQCPDVKAMAVSPYAFAPSVPGNLTPAGREGIIFVAGFAHSPNVDAALWFCKEVYPLIRQRVPGIKLSLVGSNPTTQVKELAGTDIEVTGFVSDEELAARYGAARVAIAPLHYGAGVKLKVVEALQQGVPLVTTPVGAQGLYGLAEVCAIANTPYEYAEAVIRLIEDTALWSACSNRQRQFVDDHFGRDRMRQDLERAFSVSRGLGQA